MYRSPQPAARSPQPAAVGMNSASPGVLARAIGYLFKPSPSAAPSNLNGRLSRFAAFCILAFGLFATVASGQNITTKANTKKTATNQVNGMTIDTYKSVPDGTYTAPAGSNMPDWDIRIEKGTVNSQGAFVSNNPVELPSSDTPPPTTLNAITFQQNSAVAANWSAIGYNYTWVLNDPIPQGTPTQYVRVQLRKKNFFGFMSPQAAAVVPLW